MGARRTSVFDTHGRLGHLRSWVVDVCYLQAMVIYSYVNGPDNRATHQEGNLPL
jgi:hypothetical protein